MRFGAIRSREGIRSEGSALASSDERRSRGGRLPADFGQRGTTCAGRFVSAQRAPFRRALFRRALAAVIVLATLAGCVPLPTSPSTARSGRGLEGSGSTSFLRDPAPRYEELQFPDDNPPLDESEIEIRPATFEREFSEAGASVGTIARNSEPPSLADRVQLARRDARDSTLRTAAPPTIQIGTIGRENSREPAAEVARFGDSLHARRDHLLDELSSYRGRDERDLADGERLAKHRVQVQLMALHFLLDAADSSHLEPLIDSLVHPHEPSQQHSLLAASFYESVDFEQKSAEILTRLTGTRSAEASPLEQHSFRIAPPILCTRIDGLGRYRVVDRKTFRPGTELRLYVEIFGIENREVSGKYRQRLEVEFSLVDRDGTNRGSQTSRTEGPPVDEPLVDSFLNLRYSIPREVPFGSAKLTVTVRDLISGAVSRRTVDLGIEP